MAYVSIIVSYRCLGPIGQFPTQQPKIRKYLLHKIESNVTFGL